MNIQKIASEIVFFVQKNEFSCEFFSFLDSFNEKFNERFDKRFNGHSWIERCILSNKNDVMKEFFELLNKTDLLNKANSSKESLSTEIEAQDIRDIKDIFFEIFRGNMHFEMLNILNCAKKIISLNEEIIVLHKHNINENEKSDLIKNIQKVDSNLMNRDVKFKKNSTMNENLIIVVGTEMYRL